MGFDKDVDCYDVVQNSLFAIKIFHAPPIHPDLPFTKPLANTDLCIVCIACRSQNVI